MKTPLLGHSRLRHLIAPTRSHRRRKWRQSWLPLSSGDLKAPFTATWLTRAERRRELRRTWRES
jgi:hypothetical protein